MRNLRRSLIVVDAALLEYMPDSPRAGCGRHSARSQPSPIRRSNIRGNRVNLWRSRWRRLCAGPRKWQENPSLMLPLHVPRRPFRTRVHKPASHSGKTGAAAAPARAKEIPAPDAKDLGLEPTASAIPAPSNCEDRRKQQSRGSRDRTVCQRGFGFNSASAASEAPSFTSLDGSQQASDAGGSKKTLLIAVVGDRTCSRRLFRLDQNAVCPSAAGSAAIRRSRQLGNRFAASSACSFRYPIRNSRGCASTVANRT